MNVSVGVNSPNKTQDENENKETSVKIKKKPISQVYAQILKKHLGGNSPLVTNIPKPMEKKFSQPQLNINNKNQNKTKTIPQKRDLSSQKKEVSHFLLYKLIMSYHFIIGK